MGRWSGEPGDLLRGRREGMVPGLAWKQWTWADSRYVLDGFRVCGMGGWVVPLAKAAVT